jgi:single-strand DNA-binding protein
VASFSLAVDRDYGNRDTGEKQTDFIDVVAWRQTGEFVSKYFVKGTMAAVSGRLQIRDWQDKEGNKRKSAEVVADNVYFAESKKSREGGEPARGTQPAQGVTAAAKQPSPFQEIDEADRRANAYSREGGNDLAIRYRNNQKNRKRRKVMSILRG